MGVHVEEKALMKALHTGHFMNSVVMLTVGGKEIRTLPKDVAFPEGVHEVKIVKVGNSRVISPAGQRWDTFFEDPAKLSDDFLTERDQLGRRCVLRWAGEFPFEQGL